MSTLAEQFPIAARRLLFAEQELGRVSVLEDDWDSSDPYTSRRPGLGPAPTDIFVPSAFGFHNARLGSRRHGDFPPYYRTEQHHWQIVDAARLIEGLSLTACNVLDVLSQFAIFTGFEYKVVSKAERVVGTEDEPAPKDPLVEKAQKLVDKWIKANDWYSWEVEIFRRTRRDGECFLYLEPDFETDLFRLRAIEPEQVKEPQDSRAAMSALSSNSTMSFKYGILTPREDTSRPEGYWVVSNYNDAKNIGEFIPAEEMFHLKTEWVDRQAKRGVSDFFSVTNEMHSTRKLLRNLREGAAVQAAIAWIRTHPEGSAVGAVGAPGEVNQTRHGDRVGSVTYDGPVMLDVTGKMEYTAGPLGLGGKNNALIQVLAAALRSIGARWQMPEALISGDASNANLASALVAEGPFVRAMTMRQWHYKQAYQRMMEKVLEYAAARGQLGPARDTILDKLDISIEMPPVIARKAGEETTRNETLHKNRVLSLQSWSAREDLDRQEEKANLEEDPPEEPQMPGMEDGDDALPAQAKGKAKAETKTETQTQRVT